jgi:hypothetical protein
VKANGACGSGISSKYIVLYTYKPSTPGIISGPTTLCPGNTSDYQVSAIPYATNYFWSATGGLVIISNTNTNKITVQSPAGFTGGTVKLYVANCKGSSGIRTVNIKGIPPLPVFYGGGDHNITTGVCGGSTLYKYEISPLAGVNSFIWSAPAGCTIYDGWGNSGNPLTVNGMNPLGEWEVNIKFPAGFAGGNITVKGTNTCGQGQQASLMVNSVPTQPGSIAGFSSVCKNQTNVTYSIASVPGATSYSWTITGGATITYGAGTNLIKVKFTTATSNSQLISVTANNACGTSIARTITVSVNLSCKTAADDNVSDENGFYIYPNPVNKIANIVVDGKLIKESDIGIYDIIGKSYPVNVIDISTNNGAELDLSNLSKGVYMIRVKVEEMYRIFKVVKE